MNDIFLEYWNEKILIYKTTLNLFLCVCVCKFWIFCYNLAAWTHILLVRAMHCSAKLASSKHEFNWSNFFLRLCSHRFYVVERIHSITNYLLQVELYISNRGRYYLVDYLSLNWILSRKCVLNTKHFLFGWK